MLLSSGETLRYSVYLPEGYDGKKEHPFILSLHFGGRVTPFYGGGMVEMLVAPAFEELEPIIVAPDSLQGGWNSEINQVAMTELLEQAKQEYPIDRAKTLVTGFSMGGHGTWVVASQFQDFFKAAIPVAGRGLEEDVRQKTKWTIPMYVIHSKADKIVPLGPTEKFVEKVREQGADVTFVKVDDLPHFQTYRFAEPLKASIGWLEETWARQSK